MLIHPSLTVDVIGQIITYFLSKISSSTLHCTICRWNPFSGSALSKALRNMPIPMTRVMMFFFVNMNMTSIGTVSSVLLSSTRKKRFATEHMSCSVWLLSFKPELERNLSSQFCCTGWSGRWQWWRLDFSQWSILWNWWRHGFWRRACEKPAIKIINGSYMCCRMNETVYFIFCSFPSNGFSSNRSRIVLYRTHVGASSLDCER